MKKSERRRRQQQLWQALGTVTGFNGYLNNLEHAYKMAGIVPVGIATLRDDLKYAERVIREKMKAIP